MKALLLFVVLGLASFTAAAKLPCEELKATIAAQLDAKHVVGYTLEIVPRGETHDGQVVGQCDGGTKQIVYTKAKH